MPRPLYLLSLPGLSLRLLHEARDAASAYWRIIEEESGALGALIPALPAIGAASQATLLTGTLPSQHGICRTPDDPADAPAPLERTFWRRAKDQRPELTVCAALWDASLRIDSPDWGRASFPGHHRNGERVLQLLAETVCDVTAIRMKGIAAAARSEGPRSKPCARRLASLGRIVSALFERVRERDGTAVICGEYAFVEAQAYISLLKLQQSQPAIQRIHREGQVAQIWLNGPLAPVVAALNEIQGISRVLSGSERESVGLMSEHAGDLIVLAAPHSGFERDNAGAAGLLHADPLDQPALITWGLDPCGDAGVLKPSVSSAELAWYLQAQLTETRFVDRLEG